MRKRIYITTEDMQRLRRLVDGVQASGTVNGSNLAALEEELDRAHVVDPSRIRPDVVTLNSQVRVEDLDSGRLMEYEIVYPNAKARGSADALSVIAPLGTALLGYKAGDTVEWQMPKGKRRLKVVEVLYQPESSKVPAA